MAQIAISKLAHLSILVTNIGVTFKVDWGKFRSFATLWAIRLHAFSRCLGVILIERLSSDVLEQFAPVQV